MDKKFLMRKLFGIRYSVSDNYQLIIEGRVWVKDFSCVLCMSCSFLCEPDIPQPRMVAADVQPMSWKSVAWTEGGHLIMQYLGTQVHRRDAANLVISCWCVCVLMY